jgi:hypothetical protein
MARLKDGGALVRISPRTASVVYDGADLSDWDDAELLEGRKKDRRGHFTGRKPKLVPAALHRELTKRRFQRAQALLADSLVDCVQMLRAIVNDKKADEADRIKAAEIILDRVMGKAKEHVQLDIEAQPWQRIIASAIVASEPNGDVVEGKVVEG